MLPVLSILGLVAGLAAGVPDSTELRGDALVSALRHGGYTILLRHARTDRSVVEKPGAYARLKRTEQRNLNDDGVRDARLIGAVMKRFDIPIGEILSSEMYRTRETAEYAFGDPTPHAELQQLDSSAAQREMIVAMPKPGSNRVIVTHHFIIERYAPGIRPGEIAESEAAVVRPAADGRLTLVGRFTLADWQALAPVAAPVAAQVPPAVSSSAVIPATRAGVLAREYIAAFNTGDPTTMRGFIERFLLVDANRPTEARLETFRNLFGEHGALALVSIDASAEDSVTLITRSKRGEVKLMVTASSAQAGRASSIKLAYGVPGGPNH